MHGGPGIDHTFEVEFSRECASFAQVILIDHRGNGRSIDDNPDHWNLTQWTKDVYSFSPVYFKRAILKPQVGAHLQSERASIDYRNDLPKIRGPVLYMTNTINPSHLFEVSKETAEAMTNADVTFVPFDHCGIVQYDAKEQGINEIKKFLAKYYPNPSFPPLDNKQK